MGYYTEFFKDVENKEQTIEALRKVFTISLAAFTCMHTMSIVFGNTQKSIMHRLHENMVNCLDDEHPNEETIMVLLESMELEADKNSTK